MLANVTNKAAGPRGFATLAHEIVMLEAGASALLDLVDHLLHRAWEASGEVSITPLAEKDARATRKRLDAEAEARAAAQASALAGLPRAAPAQDDTRPGPAAEVPRQRG